MQGRVPVALPWVMVTLQVVVTLYMTWLLSYCAKLCAAASVPAILGCSKRWTLSPHLPMKGRGGCQALATPCRRP